MYDGKRWPGQISCSFFTVQSAVGKAPVVDGSENIDDEKIVCVLNEEEKRLPHYGKTAGYCKKSDNIPSDEKLDFPLFFGIKTITFSDAAMTIPASVRAKLKKVNHRLHLNFNRAWTLYLGTNRR